MTRVSEAIIFRDVRVNCSRALTLDGAHLAPLRETYAPVPGSSLHSTLHSNSYRSREKVCLVCHSHEHRSFTCCFVLCSVLCHETEEALSLHYWACTSSHVRTHYGLLTPFMFLLQDMQSRRPEKIVHVAIIRRDDQHFVRYYCVRATTTRTHVAQCYLMSLEVWPSVLAVR